MDDFEKASDEIEERNYDTNNENVIEFLRDAKTATVCFTQGRLISRIKKLQEQHPEQVKITAENRDGSIVAHIPVKWVKINPPKDLTEEQREKLRGRALDNFHNS